VHNAHIYGYYYSNVFLKSFDQGDLLFSFLFWRTLPIVFVPNNKSEINNMIALNVEIYFIVFL